MLQSAESWRRRSWIYLLSRQKNRIIWCQHLFFLPTHTERNLDPRARADSYVQYVRKIQRETRRQDKTTADRDDQPRRQRERGAERDRQPKRQQRDQTTTDDDRRQRQRHNRDKYMCIKPRHWRHRQTWKITGYSILAEYGNQAADRYVS